MGTHGSPTGQRLCIVTLLVLFVRYIPCLNIAGNHSFSPIEKACQPSQKQSWDNVNISVLSFCMVFGAGGAWEVIQWLAAEAILTITIDPRDITWAYGPCEILRSCQPSENPSIPSLFLRIPVWWEDTPCPSAQLAASSPLAAFTTIASATHYRYR